jgi:hypothetical protein
VLQGPPKQINRSGTRLASAGPDRVHIPSNEEPDRSASVAAGADFSVLATPSFTPGVEESPFITWGDLEGTPLRLDADEDFVVNPADAAGPQFRVPEVCPALTQHVLYSPANASSYWPVGWAVFA